MKIVLAFPPFYHPSLYNLPPLGLINIGTVLKSTSFDVTLVDLVLDYARNRARIGKNVYDHATEHILSYNPDMVAFSTQCTTLPAVIQISRKIKAERPGVTIISGGHDASFAHKKILGTFPCIDIVVRGEGEITFRDLMTSLRDQTPLDAISGITYRENSTIRINPSRSLMADLNDLPFADYTLVNPLSVYRRACGIPRSIAIIEVGRGCPHACLYCSQSAFWQRQTRLFSPDRIIKEMKHLHESFGAECFLLSYDQFTANRVFVEDFCTRLIDHRLHHIPWYCISRLDTVDDSLLHLMKTAGCESMCYGIDSGSKHTLALINKKIDEPILFERVKSTTNQGMVPTLSFIIGFQEERQEDIDATLNLALKTGIQGNSNPLIQLPTVLQGTELFKRHQNELIRETDTYFSVGLEFNNGKRLLGDEALINSDPSLFSCFYNIPHQTMDLKDLACITTCFPLIVRLYPKSFFLLARVLNTSVSALFLSFFKYAQFNKKTSQKTLTAPDCYHLMKPFCKNLLGSKPTDGFSHLPEVIEYETVAIKSGKPSFQHYDGSHRNIENLLEKPLLKENVSIRQFSYPLSEIVNDLKENNYSPHYNKRPTNLVFFHEDNELEVLEINDFGHKLLLLCNGKTKISHMSELLHRTYGKGENFSKFNKTVSTAVHDLKGVGLFS